MERTPPPAPGIYEGIPFDEYAAWDAYNWSALKHVDWSLARFKSLWENGKDPNEEQKKAQFEGTVLHAMLLEPEEARTRYVATPATYPTLDKFGDSDLVIRPLDKTGTLLRVAQGRGKARRTWPVQLRADGEGTWTADYPEGCPRGSLIVSDHRWVGHAKFCRNWAEDMAAKGVTIVPRDIRIRCAEMAAAARSIPAVAEALDGATKEVCLVWQDDATGLMCKGRLDALKAACILDIKTSAFPVGDNDGFARTVIKWLYNGQAAMYCDGLMAALKAQGKKLTSPPVVTFLGIEKVHPYHAQPWEVSSHPESGSFPIYQSGHQMWQAYLKSVAYALQTGIWPGGTHDRDEEVCVPTPRELLLPDYLLARLQPASTFGPWDSEAAAQMAAMDSDDDTLCPDPFE